MVSVLSLFTGLLCFGLLALMERTFPKALGLQGKVAIRRWLPPQPS
jgi:hypothetical protein